MPQPPSYVCLKNAFSKLRYKSSGVIVTAFAEHEPYTDQHRAIVDTVNEAIEAEHRSNTGGIHRAVLFLVASEQRGQAVARMLHRLMDKRATMMNFRKQASSLDKDLVIVRASYALQLFRNDKLSMPRLCTLVFDVAEHASRLSNT